MFFNCPTKIQKKNIYIYIWKALKRYTCVDRSTNTKKQKKQLICNVLGVPCQLTCLWWGCKRFNNWHSKIKYAWHSCENAFIELKWAFYTFKVFFLLLQVHYPYKYEKIGPVEIFYFAKVIWATVLNGMHEYLFIFFIIKEFL